MKSNDAGTRFFPRTQANKNRAKQPTDIICLIIELISGALGGNVAGAAMKKPLYNLMIINHSFAKVASTL